MDVNFLYSQALASLSTLQRDYEVAVDVAREARRQAEEAALNAEAQDRTVQRAKEEAAAKARAVAEAIQNASMSASISSLASIHAEEAFTREQDAEEALSAARANVEQLAKMFSSSPLRTSDGKNLLQGANSSSGGAIGGLRVSAPDSTSSEAPHLFPQQQQQQATLWGAKQQTSPSRAHQMSVDSKARGNGVSSSSAVQMDSAAHTPTCADATAPVCKDYLNGKCILGKNRMHCKFYHPTSAQDANPDPQKTKNKEQPCIDFLNGRCSRGDACKYTHHGSVGSSRGEGDWITKKGRA